MDPKYDPINLTLDTELLSWADIPSMSPLEGNGEEVKEEKEI